MYCAMLSLLKHSRRYNLATCRGSSHCCERLGRAESFPESAGVGEDSAMYGIRLMEQCLNTARPAGRPGGTLLLPAFQQTELFSQSPASTGTQQDKTRKTEGSQKGRKIKRTFQ